jgi:hypothetical protein
MEVGWPDPAEQIAQLRSALGENAFDVAWGEGRAMTFAESISYALQDSTERIGAVRPVR